MRQEDPADKSLAARGGRFRAVSAFGRQEDSADKRFMVGGITLTIVLAATFIAALVVSGVFSGGPGTIISIGEDTQTLGPDPDGDSAVTEQVENEPEPAETVEPVLLTLGDSGEQVRELQARLRRVRWYETEITGEYDGVTVEAVRGFQDKRGFEPTGDVDRETWNQLTEMTGTPSEDEMYNRLVAGETILGPEDEGEQVRELQARLAQIGWFDNEITGTYGATTVAAVEGFQIRRGLAATGEVDQLTWDTLLEMSAEPTEDELGDPATEDPEAPNPGVSGLPEECRSGRVLCLDTGAQRLRWIIDGSVELNINADIRDTPPAGGATVEGEWWWWDALRISGGWDIRESGGDVNVGNRMDDILDAVNEGDAVFVYSS